jgi:hypothetical protein
MLICNHCGHRAESLNSGRIYNDNLLGGYIDQKDTTCPCCKKGDMILATQCSFCGSWFDNTELHGVCEMCLEEHETVGEALEFGECRTEKVEINGFIANVLSTEKINEILTKYVEENFTDHSKPVIDYCEYDKSDFSEYVENKVG